MPFNWNNIPWFLSQIVLFCSGQPVGDPTQRGQSCQEGQGMCSAGEGGLLQNLGTRIVKIPAIPAGYGKDLCWERKFVCHNSFTILSVDKVHVVSNR